MISRNYFKGDSMKLNRIINADCMEIMKDIPDKYFELAIVDPPYGIGESAKKRENTISEKWSNPYKKTHNVKTWDYEKPDKKYFNELFRISKNQIVFGGNYFVEYLFSTMCWIFWDKKNGDSDFSDGELAWTSFNSGLRKFSWLWNGFQKEKPEPRFHPTQKPVALYRWLLQNYAKTGDKIIDTHSGSGSLACACHLEKFNFLAIELDEDYYRDSVKRLDELRSQGVLF